MAETIPEIIKHASICFNVSTEELMSASRISNLVKIRLIVAYTVRSKFKRVPLKILGMHFNRDHSTVINMLNRYNSISKTDREFQDMIFKFMTFRFGY